MAGGGAETDKRFDQRTFSAFPPYTGLSARFYQITRGALGARTSTLGSHAVFSLSLSHLEDFSQSSSLMDPSTKWYRLIDVDLSMNVCWFLATLLGNRFLFKNLGENCELQNFLNHLVKMYVMI